MTAREPQELHGRHALVTGGGRGIGAAIATALAARGARVTIVGRTRETLDAHAAELRAVGAEVGVQLCDVTDESAVERAFTAAAAQFGQIYALVNNAGAATPSAFTETSRSAWDAMLAANLTSAYLCSARVLPAMLEAGDGRIVNIASTAGLKGYAKMTAYTAAKHGVIGLTRALAVETAKRGVTVNAICPSYTDTAMAAGAIDNIVRALGKTSDEALAMLVRPIPRGRLTSPDEVASAVAWLCSPSAAAVTGAALPVAGGEVM